MTVRRNPITGEPVLFAPERAARPRAFTDSADDARCPFCPGHEADTPPEIARIGDPWRVRVIPNKYPALPGAEVIVEAAEHDATSASLTHTADVVRVYAERYRAHRDAAYVSIFRNEGAGAGGSFDHVHSQLIPMPFVPPRIERESNAFARSARCPLCTGGDAVVIRETSTMTWLAPAASSMAYQQWIVPKRHVTNIAALDSAELDELAPLLRAAYAGMHSIAGALNSCLINFPRAGAGHFYVDLFPRVTAIAGFELATGTFVEIIDPAAAAQRLRG
ncbi:MAG TPA: hypothetical protein VNA69_24735 [Thermoanaerobaculia bacterium]|nr:hypothetical protein [Thermoanaerobaculia bacterium]